MYMFQNNILRFNKVNVELYNDGECHWDSKLIIFRLTK